MTELEQGTEDDFELEIFKTVLIGDSAVGKTSIISAFTKGFFDENQEVTTSANYSSKALYYEPYEKGCHFQIWDTCGQEKYRSLNYIFYKDAKIAILVYDITQRKSYQSIVEYWYDEVKQKAAKDTLIVLCANKSDLIEDEIVDPVLAAKWAKGYGVPFFQISAKNIKGIRDLFVDLSFQLHQSLIFFHLTILQMAVPNRAPFSLLSHYHKYPFCKKFYEIDDFQ